MMDTRDVMIYVDTADSETPWVLRYRDEGSASGWNEVHVARISSRKPFVTSIVDEHSLRQGRYAIKSAGRILIGVDTEGFKHALIE
jgi:hypothetical protein